MLAFALTWAACSTPPISRIDEHREAYESWPLEVRQLVLDGHVAPGMTRSMVYLSWGQPHKVAMGTLLGEESWLYEEAFIDGPVVERRIVIFRGGRVVAADIQRY